MLEIIHAYHSEMKCNRVDSPYFVLSSPMV